MGEEEFVASAQIVQSRLSIRRLEEMVLGASPVAHGSDFAFHAMVWQRFQLGFSEDSLCWAFEQLDQWCVFYVSEAVFRVHKVVA